MVYYLTPQKPSYGLELSMESAKANYLVWAVPLAFFIVFIALCMVAKPAMLSNKDDSGKVIGLNYPKVIAGAVVMAAIGVAVVKFAL